jgi:peptidoglycan biosynthesis protein MviN/MurJ (putative lipid II flippase)
MRDWQRPVLLHYALLSPAIIGWAVSGVYGGALVAALRLERSAIANAFRGIGALVGALVAAAAHNLYFLPLGISAGETARALWLRRAWFEVTKGEEGAASPGPVVAGLGRFRQAAGSQIAAQGLLAAAPLVERFVAGAMAIAWISRIEYAYRLLMVCAVLFDGGIAPWLLARGSRLRSTGNFSGRWEEVANSLRAVAAVSAAIGATLAIAAPLVVRTLFLRGSFTETDVSIVTSLLRWYSVGFVANMVVLCAERALLATAQNRRFLQLGVVRVVSRVGCVALFAGTLGVITFPLAYAVSEIIYLGLVVATMYLPAPVAVRA